MQFNSAFGRRKYSRVKNHYSALDHAAYLPVVVPVSGLGAYDHHHHSQLLEGPDPRNGLGLIGVRSILDDGLLVNLGLVDDIVSGDELDHLAADLLGEGPHELLFPVNIAGVADDTAQARSAGFSKLLNALADVVGRIQSHHLAGGDDVDLLGLSSSRMGMAKPPQTTSPRTS